MLHKNILSEETRELFDTINGLEALKSFTLVGGTALALQEGHRKSLDLDFAIFREMLVVQEIDALLAVLKESGRKVELITPASSIVTARINGIRLLDHVRDYMVDNVKIQFFAPQERQQAMFFDAYPRIDAGGGFSIMSRDGIFAMKTAILDRRTKSRDMFDLMHMLKNCGYTIDDLFSRATQTSPGCNIEIHKAALTGITPLDEDDEGFEAVDVKVGIGEVYDFFLEAVNDYEQRVAAKIALELRHVRNGCDPKP